MPSPDQAMFINLFTSLKSKKAGENDFKKVSACTLIGPQITPFTLLVEESHIAISIIFQPGGLNRFLNIPMTEIFDNGYIGREVIGKEIEELVDKLHYTGSLEELSQIVQSYFLRKLTKLKEALPLDFALQQLLLNYNTNLDKIADLACMSIRNFERKCKERLGMPAKMYARITRFNRAYKMLENNPNISLSGLTYEVGYYDQNHFIKDFKEFARMTPSGVHKDFKDRFQLDWDRV